MPDQCILWYYQDEVDRIVNIIKESRPMSTRFKKVMPILSFLLVFTWFLCVYKVDVNCEQCGLPVTKESIAARIASGFEDNFLHKVCVIPYLNDNPLEYDENGEMIRKN